MSNVLNKEGALAQLTHVTKLSYGEDYFVEVAKLIHNLCQADYTFITKIDNEKQIAEPLISIKYGIPIENIQYDLRQTPCYEVTNTCVGYYPKDVQKLFPEDDYLKAIRVNGYLGASVVPEGEDLPVLILTCLYEHDVEDAANKLELLKFIANNMQDRVEREILIKENIRNKTIIKEIHHRIKNNLQVISSLLGLQKLKIKDPKAIELLNKSQERISAIGLVHQFLYQSKDLKTVNVSDYIKNLVELLKSNYDSSVDIELHIEKHVLDIDVLVPCGLILNEAISNSLKYAFKGTEHRKIIVKFSKEGDCYQLSVKDNGMGFSESILNSKQPDTLGMELMQALAQQINGKLLMENDSGAYIQIRFSN